MFCWSTGGQGLAELLDLGIAKCRLMRAVPRGKPNQHSSHRQLKVASKYIRSAQRFYQRHGINAQMIKLSGAMELAPLVGLADEIVDLVDTGATLEANNLQATEVIAQISSRLIANPAALRTRHADLRPMLEAFEKASGGPTD